jgi:hypothetical protein
MVILMSIGLNLHQGGLKAETLRAISEIDKLTRSDWQRLRERAASLKVGSERWESAWLAAHAGHAAATAAQAQALRAGASLLAAAAVAGAVAALEAADQLTGELFACLTEPAERVVRPPGTRSASRCLAA